MRLLVLMIAAITIAACAFAQQGPKTLFWDGHRFAEGNSNGKWQLEVADGRLPVPYQSEARPANLPPGTGAAVIFCFVEAGPGKRGTPAASLSVAGLPVELKGKPGTFILRTAEDGIAIIALPAGRWEASAAGITTNIKIETGKTATTALKVGRRSY